MPIACEEPCGGGGKYRSLRYFVAEEGALASQRKGNFIWPLHSHEMSFHGSVAPAQL